jgi:Rrf2 family protein
MKVSALEEYGLRCMILLARCGKAGVSMTIPEISEKEQLSRPYVGKLLMILKQSGLIRAVRGRNGGYTLTKPPKAISLREIFNALGEPVFGPNHCERFHTVDGVCVHLDDCAVRGIWSRFNEFMNNYYDQTTLADLAFGANGQSTESESDPKNTEIKSDVLTFTKLG